MSLDLWLHLKWEACEHCGRPAQEETVFDGNYTHNVTPMWSKAGVYDALYHSPDVKAGSLVEVLERGLRHMKENPQKYIPLNPSNGWGDYNGAVKFLGRFTKACKKYPESIVSLWK